MPDRHQGAHAVTHLVRHLARGAIGFGLVGSAFVLSSSAGPTALLLALPGLVALRGCPMCWIAGLIQAISAGRLERTCTNDSCTPRPSTSTTIGTYAVGELSTGTRRSVCMRDEIVPLAEGLEPEGPRQPAWPLTTS